jgi:hypothetical protein
MKHKQKVGLTLAVIYLAVIIGSLVIWTNQKTVTASAIELESNPDRIFSIGDFEGSVTVRAEAASSFSFVNVEYGEFLAILPLDVYSNVPNHTVSTDAEFLLRGWWSVQSSGDDVTLLFSEPVTITQKYSENHRRNLILFLNVGVDVCLMLAFGLSFLINKPKPDLAE